MGSRETFDVNHVSFLGSYHHNKNTTKNNAEQERTPCKQGRHIQPARWRALQFGKHPAPFTTDPAYLPRPTLIQKRASARALILNVPRHLFHHIFLAFICSNFVICDLLHRGLLGCLSRAVGVGRGAVPSPPSFQEFFSPRHHSLAPLAHLSIATVQSLVSTPKIPGVNTGRGEATSNALRSSVTLFTQFLSGLPIRASPPLEHCPKHHAFRFAAYRPALSGDVSGQRKRPLSNGCLDTHTHGFFEGGPICQLVVGVFLLLLQKTTSRSSRSWWMGCTLA